MKKKYIPVLLIAVALIAALGAWIILSHNSSDNKRADDSIMTEEEDLTESDDEELIEKEEGNGIAFDAESDDAVFEKKEADESAYYGAWEATSDLALYLYGSIDILVKEDGTWEGHITGEPLGGKYDYLGDHMHMNDDLFSFDLAFDQDGNLIMIDTDSDDEIHIVLTKAE